MGAIKKIKRWGSRQKRELIDEPISAVKSIGRKTGNLWNDATGVTANREANKIQQEGARNALAQQREMYDISRADLQPWREAGTKYLSQLSSEMDSGLYNQDTPEFQGEAFNYQEDPGYKFRQAEGEKLLQRQAALRGNMYGGKNLRDLSRFNQGLASAEINNAYNRYADTRNFNYSNFADSFSRKRTTLNDRFTRLSSLVTGGQNAAAGQASQAMQFGENASNSIQGMANANAASRIAQYNQQRGAVEGLINTGIDATAMYMLGGASKAVPTGSRKPFTALDVGNG